MNGSASRVAFARLRSSVGELAREKYLRFNRSFGTKSVPPPLFQRALRSMSRPQVESASLGLAYVGSRIERAAAQRGDATALAAFAGDPRAGFCVIGGEVVLLKKCGEVFAVQ